MSWLRRILLTMAFAGAIGGAPLFAQPAPGGGPAASVKSPVALFRELLAMTPQQRRDVISIRPPDIQKRILEKLNEYELLPGELRELRLRETELRWYLRPLMDQPRTSRAAALARVPEELRGQVTERLQVWDLLPPPLQEEFKDNDLIAGYFAQLGTPTPAQLAEILAQIPPERREELQKGLSHWQEMSETQRRQAMVGFNNFFELTPEQREKTLDTVSDEDRAQMEQTLSAYAHLTPAQRAQCINSFEKFAGMNVAERQQFLKNAERWQEMTPGERQKWRELVTVAPIMPPGWMPRVPILPGRSQLQDTPAVATN